MLADVLFMARGYGEVQERAESFHMFGDIVVPRPTNPRMSPGQGTFQFRCGLVQP